MSETEFEPKSPDSTVHILISQARRLPIMAPEPASHGLNEPNLGITSGLKEQQDLGAGEGSTVSFQQGVEGHAEKASFCGSQRAEGAFHFLEWQLGSNLRDLVGN